jgi:hypothetical protein
MNIELGFDFLPHLTCKLAEQEGMLDGPMLSAENA